MTYSDFKTSANRHLKSCWCILNSHVNDEDSLKNVYYLSGYVLECSIKYCIYSLSVPPKNKYDEIEKLDAHLPKKLLNKDGKNKILVHSLENLKEYLEIIVQGGSASTSNIPIIGHTNGISHSSISLFKEWKVDFRYKIDKSKNPSAFDKSLLLEYLQLCENIHKKLINIC